MTIRIRPVTLVRRLAAGFLMTACGTEGSPGAFRAAATIEPILPTVTQDSGVLVMEHGPDALDRAPRLVVDSAPVMTVGGAEGDPQYDLTRVSFAVPLTDGRFMAFSRIGNLVMLFGRDGRGERIFGRTGKGPGDWMSFGDPRRLAGDTLLIIDFGNQRLNWLTADQGVVRTAPLTLSGAMNRLGSVAGFLPGGEAIMHSAGSWGGHQTDSLNRSLATVVALSPATSSARTIVTLPDLIGVEFETNYRGRKAMDWRPLRLSGTALVAVWDSSIATTSATDTRIDLRGADGAVLSRIVLLRPARAVTDAMRASRVELELARLSAPGMERAVDPGESRRIAREAPFADSLPGFSSLATAPDGTLWAVDAIAPSDSTWSATAFRKDGAIVGRLHVRGRSTPMAFGDGRVIVRTEDEDGVVALLVLAIRFASGEPWESDQSRRVPLPPPS
ncbi:MAG TPA: hypothetical protein VF981_05660 [Gemmatimonadaceae bacterium]